MEQSTAQPLIAYDCDDEKRRVSDRWKNSLYAPFVYAFLASLSSVMAGYCVGVMSGAVFYVNDELNITDSQIEVLMGSLAIVSVVGSLICGVLADVIGRRKTILISAGITLIGCGIMSMSNGYSLLLVGRIITGMGVGFPYVLAPLYVAEVSSPKSRGMLISFPEIMLNAGILLGYVSSFCLSELPISVNWRLMLGLGSLLALTVAGGVLIIPESPRWLVLQRRIDEAFSVLVKICDSNEEAELRLADIILAAETFESEEKASNSKLTSLTPSTEWERATSRRRLINSNETAQAWKELIFPSRQVSKILFIALGLQFFQQTTGIGVLVYYAPQIFSEAGFQNETGDLGATVAVGLAKTLFILVATFFLDRSGRRPLLLVSSFGMTLSMFLLAVSFWLVNLGYVAQISSSLTVTSSILFVSFFSIAFGPMCGLIASEVFPLRLRAQGVSLSMAFNRSLGGLLCLNFLSIMNVLSPSGTFFMFAAVSVIATAFVYLVIPETKGKTLEELS